MGIEIERKFLVKHKQWQLLTKPAGTNLRQGYLINDADKTIRVRVDGEHAWVTFKGAVSGITRSEYEYAIPVKDGVEMLDQFAGTIVNKTRYKVSFENKVWEVDVFLGDNEGLIVAEIELKREDEIFSLPPWIMHEVTGQEKYYNSKLAVHPFKKW